MYMKNNLIGQITVAVLAVIGTVWYLFVYQPNQQALARDKVMRSALAKCLEDADDNYYSAWNESCKTTGMNHRKDDCLLPSGQAEQVEQWKRDEAAGCYKKFPVK